MTEVATRLIQDGSSTHIVRHQDVESILDSAQELRSNGITGSADFRHVGRIPAVVLEMWINEAGVRPDDNEAVREIIRKKLMSGEFQKLRVHEGTF